VKVTLGNAEDLVDLGNNSQKEEEDAHNIGDQDKTTTLMEPMSVQIHG
jgi:hypothetical protein